jgi:hypothetical protein
MNKSSEVAMGGGGGGVYLYADTVIHRYTYLALKIHVVLTFFATPVELILIH